MTEVIQEIENQTLTEYEIIGARRLGVWLYLGPHKEDEETA